MDKSTEKNKCYVSYRYVLLCSWKLKIMLVDGQSLVDKCSVILCVGNSFALEAVKTSEHVVYVS